jgi:hypothetical protein
MEYLCEELGEETVDLMQMIKRTPDPHPGEVRNTCFRVFAGSY